MYRLKTSSFDMFSGRGAPTRVSRRHRRLAVHSERQFEAGAACGLYLHVRCKQCCLRFMKSYVVSARMRWSGDHCGLQIRRGLTSQSFDYSFLAFFSPFVLSSLAAEAPL